MYMSSAKNVVVDTLQALVTDVNATAEVLRRGQQKKVSALVQSCSVRQICFLLVPRNLPLTVHYFVCAFILNLRPRVASNTLLDNLVPTCTLH